jgi:glycosyltransferase involved in cell wall biosynthesis
LTLDLFPPSNLLPPNHNIFVIIPALNEAASIAHVVRDALTVGVCEVIVVDNGSSDNTSDIARNAGATVLREDRRGYGYACLAGIAYARSRACEIIVFLDGDYSDFPEELPAVVLPIIENRADIVIGSRATGKRERGALLPQQRFGNWLATRLIHLRTGVRFTDLGPFRAITITALDQLDMRDGTYGWTVEMQMKAAKQHLRCVEVPVRYRKRIGESKVSGTLRGTVMASVNILGMIGKLW